MSVSPSRITAREETLRSTVGREADVPRKRRVSDMRAKYMVTPKMAGTRFASLQSIKLIAIERVKWRPER
jgi:hypothetical protein